MGAFESNTFDFVVCTFVLCSVRDTDKALSEVKRVLKPISLYQLFVKLLL
jgi:ubiquinone/menaquinone biosynthesis C-methylase UbiE